MEINLAFISLPSEVELLASPPCRVKWQPREKRQTGIRRRCCARKGKEGREPTICPRVSVYLTISNPWLRGSLSRGGIILPERREPFPDNLLLLNLDIVLKIADTRIRVEGETKKEKEREREGNRGSRDGPTGLRRIFGSTSRRRFTSKT